MSKNAIILLIYYRYRLSDFMKGTASFMLSKQVITNKALQKREIQ
jgi:hypothetical protein